MVKQPEIVKLSPEEKQALIATVKQKFFEDSKDKDIYSKQFENWVGDKG